MPTTLLAIDDSVTMRKVLEMTFAGEDFRVVTADSADAAFAKLRSDRPGVVLCDVTLDGQGGYAICAKIKTENPTVAVLLMASKQQPYDAHKGQGARADDFIEKPFDTQQLIDKVKRLASRPVAAEPARPAAQPAPPASAPTAQPAAPLAAAGATRPGVAPSAPGVRPAAPPVQGATGPRYNAAPGASVAQGIGRGTLAYGGGFVAPAPPAPATPATPPQSAPAGGGLAGRPPVPAAAAPAPASAPVSQVTAQGLAPHVPAAVAAAAAPAAAAAVATAAVANASNGQLAAKLQHLGLSDAQVSAVLSLSREVIEKVVWEVVPVLAETMIKEEIKRLTAE